MESETSLSLLVEHTFTLVDPYRDRAVLVLFYLAVHRHECGRTMMLRPVELNTSANPRTGKTHECWLDDMVVVDEVTLLNLVVCHLYTSTKFWENHNLYIFILHIYGLILLVHLFVSHAFDDRIRIDHTT